MIANLAAVLSRCAAIMSLCAAVAAPASKRVCAPEQWSAGLHGRMTRVFDGSVEVLSSRARMYVDYKNGKQAFLQVVSLGVNDSSSILVVTDFNQNKSYEIYPDSKTCTVRDIPNSANEFKRPCIGDEDLKLVVSLKIGGEMADMLEMIFHNTTSQTTVMRNSFTPISSIIEQNYDGTLQMTAFQYGNVSETITNFDIFDLPAYCVNTEGGAAMEEVKLEEFESKPVHVCAPDLWEAVGVGRLALSIQGQTMIVSMRAKQANDYVNKKQALTLDIEYAGIMVTVRDWEEGQLYQYYPMTKVCDVLPLPAEQMVTLCSDSEELRLLDSMVVNGKMADMYQVMASENITSYLTVFRDTFELISSVDEQYYMNVPQMQAFQIGNFSEGIKDKSVFDIPEYCKWHKNMWLEK